MSRLDRVSGDKEDLSPLAQHRSWGPRWEPVCCGEQDCLRAQVVDVLAPDSMARQSIEQGPEGPSAAAYFAGQAEEEALARLHLLKRSQARGRVTWMWARVLRSANQSPRGRN